MIAGLQTVAILALVALPGASYTWGFEQSAGAWGVGLADRTLRFIGASAVYHAAVAPLSYWFYTGQVGSGRFSRGQFWWPSWPLTLGYLIVPFLIGRLVGRGTRNGRPWARLLAGPAPAPRAWDHVFVAGRSAWLRIRLKDAAAGTDGWVLGVFGPSPVLASYAGGSFDAPDLFLADTVEVEPTTGHFRLGADGRPVLRGIGLLIRYEDILYVEVMWS